jgi:hypothetical protein
MGASGGDELADLWVEFGVKGDEITPAISHLHDRLAALNQMALQTQSTLARVAAQQMPTAPAGNRAAALAGPPIPMLSDQEWARRRQGLAPMPKAAPEPAESEKAKPEATSKPGGMLGAALGRMDTNALETQRAGIAKLNEALASGQYAKAAQGWAEVDRAANKALARARWEEQVAYQGRFQAALSATSEKLRGIGNASAWTFGIGTTAVLGFVRAASPEAFDTFTKSIQLLSAEIGTSFVKDIIKASFHIQDAAHWVRDLSQETKDHVGHWIVLGTGIAGVGMILPKVVAGMQLAITVVGGLKAALTALNLSTGGTLAILGVVAGVGMAAVHSGGSGGKSGEDKGPLANLSETFGGVMEKLKPLGDVFGQLFKAVSPVMEKLGKAIINVAEAALPVLVQVVQAVVDLFKIFQPVLNSVVDIAQAVLVPALSLLSEVLKPVITVIKFFATAIGKAIDAINIFGQLARLANEERRAEALEAKRQKLTPDKRAKEEKARDVEIEKKRREVDRLHQEGKHQEADRAAAELEKMIRERGAPKGKATGKTPQWDTPTGGKKKKEQEQEHFLAMPKEMQPHFTGIDSARKEFQLAALGKDQFETEMLRIAREQYQVALQQLEESRRKNKGGPRAESDNDRHGGGGKIDWNKAGDWTGL